MNLTVISYLIYLPLSIAVTMLVGHTLFKNGRMFLVDIFAQNTRLADSVNKLLLMGFYLINIGYVTMNLSNGHDILSVEHLIEKLSYKFGVLLLVSSYGFCNASFYIFIYLFMARLLDIEMDEQQWVQVCPTIFWVEWV